MDSYEKLLPKHEERLSAYRAYSQLYSNRHLTDDSISSFLDAQVNVYDNKHDRLPFNLIRMGVGDVMNRIGKLAPRPQFTTFGGNRSLRRKAEDLTKWNDHLIAKHNVFKQATKALLDVCVVGIGFVKVQPDYDWMDVDFSRVYPGEIVIDPYDGMYGKPSQLIQRRLVPRRQMIARFPEHKEKLLVASRPNYSRWSDRSYGWSEDLDLIEVIEAWHLPTTPKSKDGAHMLAVDTCELRYEEWKHREFPFAVMRWDEDQRGYFGVVLAEIMLGAHLDYNTMKEKMDQIIHLAANPIVLNPKNSGVSNHEITNDPGQVWTHTPGAPPTFYTPNVFSADMWRQLEVVQNRGLQEPGLISVSFGGNAPNGLESAPAVRAYHNVETERLALAAKDFEKFVLKIAELAVRAGKALYEHDSGYTVVAEDDKNTIRKVQWKDIDMEEDDFTLRVTPVSAFSTSTASRIAEVTDLIDRGVVEPREGADLLGFPDLDKHRSLAQSEANLLDHHMEQMLDDGVYMAPEPFADFSLALKKGQEALARAMVDGVPEDRLDLVRRYLTQVNAMRVKAEQEAAMQQMPQPASAPLPDQAGQSPTALTGLEPGV